MYIYLVIYVHALIIIFEINMIYDVHNKYFVAFIQKQRRNYLRGGAIGIPLSNQFFTVGKAVIAAINFLQLSPKVLPSGR